jgi:hypothetical protein
LGRRDVYSGFGWGNLKKRDYLVGNVVDGMIILKWISKQKDVGLV